MIIQSNYEINVSSLVPGQIRPFQRHLYKIELGPVSREQALQHFDNLTELFAISDYESPILTLNAISYEGKQICEKELN